MKKVPVCILAAFLFFSVKIYAQTGDTTMQKDAVAVCDCLSKSKIDNNSTPQQLQQMFLGCIFSSAPDLVTKMMSGGQENQQAAEEIATNLALEMVKNGCPAFTKIANAMMGGAGGGDDTMQMEMPMAAPSKIETVQTADGIVTNVEEKDFTYITVKTPAGRELTFIYYEYVPGSDDWIKNPATLLKGKNVTVGYTEDEVYQPKFKQFMNMREIKTLSIK